MKFDIPNIWERFRSKPKWVQAILFVFVALTIVALFVWKMVRCSATSETVGGVLSSLYEEKFEEDLEATEKKSDGIDRTMEKEKEHRENLKKEQCDVHVNKEGIRDEIRNANGISAITNALRNGRS